MAIEKDFFRQVMGQFATGVTVATTCNHGRAAGLTVSAFASVSLEPPLVLICVDLRSNVLAHFRKSGIFAVNILTNRQESLSRCFATMSEERYENFCHAGYHVAATGAPILDGVLAFVDARIIAEYPGGDHAIFLGKVEAMGTDGEVTFASEAGERYSTLTEYLPKDSDEADLLDAKRARMPLAYYRGQYRHLSKDYQRPSLAAYYDEDFE